MSGSGELAVDSIRCRRLDSAGEASVSTTRFGVATPWIIADDMAYGAHSENGRSVNLAQTP